VVLVLLFSAKAPSAAAEVAAIAVRRASSPQPCVAATVSGVFTADALSLFEQACGLIAQQLTADHLQLLVTTNPYGNEISYTLGIRILW
jgi:hypothetical protein